LAFDLLVGRRLVRSQPSRIKVVIGLIGAIGVAELCPVPVRATGWLKTGSATGRLLPSLSPQTLGGPKAIRENLKELGYGD
jgi:hypothetical protein